MDALRYEYTQIWLIYIQSYMAYTMVHQLSTDEYLIVSAFLLLHTRLQWAETILFKVPHLLILDHISETLLEGLKV